LALENDGQPYPPNIVSRMEVFAHNVLRFEPRGKHGTGRAVDRFIERAGQWMLTRRWRKTPPPVTPPSVKKAGETHVPSIRK